MSIVQLLPLILLVSCGSRQEDSVEILEPQPTQIQGQDSPEESSTEDQMLPTSDLAKEDQGASTASESEMIETTLIVDASDYEVPVYLGYEAGSLHVVSATDDWDLTMKRTQFQTNSGTSGAGNLGVFDSTSTDWQQIISCTYSELAFDELLPVPGPPGSGTFSGNPVLNQWYDYDFITHQVSSKRLVYVLSDGPTCFKLQILSYGSGVFELTVGTLGASKMLSIK